MFIFKWQQNKKKVSEKVLFSLMARPLPPPLLVVRPLVDAIFLQIFLKQRSEMYERRRHFVVVNVTLSKRPKI